MNDPEVISFIAEEMLTEPGIKAEFVIKVSKLAQEDREMYKLMQLYMYFPDFDNDGKNETLRTIYDYMHVKNLWVPRNNE
jgi:hypothetical protein